MSTPPSPTPPPLLGRKRSLAETNSTDCGGDPDGTTTHEETMLTDTDTDGNTAALSEQQELPRFDRLRLEAIFYPKFDNETSEKSIRAQMTQHLQQNEGYLEVSLKHSGSLILWSGGGDDDDEDDNDDDRFYSKNSTANQYSHAGQLLLRQHFLRVYFRNEENDDPVAMATQKYRECSTFLHQRRLTMAFEVIIANMGDHGQRPCYDYLILTAVADRAHERFYSTAELVELAHRFRLPHNDYFVFDNGNKLFQLYDTMKATGRASTVIPALEQAARLHVASMYPHSIYQGDILEGVVVRYVPFDNTLNQSLEQLQRHCRQAIEMKNLVSATPPYSQLVQQLQEVKGNNNPLPLVYSTNLRELLLSLRRSNELDSAAAAVNLTNKMREILEIPSKVTRIPTMSRMMPSSSSFLPSRIASLVNNSSPDDEETRRIATVVRTLNQHMKTSVDYALFVVQKQNKGHNNDNTLPRMLVVVHVRHDSVFARFEKLRRQHDMKLYRGFVVELLDSKYSTSLCSGNGSKTRSSTTNQALPMSMPVDIEEDDNSKNGPTVTATEQPPPPLMLKMKFLPYMVRTFGCRNGLRVLNQQRGGGPTAFVKYTNDLLHKWQMPDDAKQHWRPFFLAWAQHVSRLMTNNVVVSESNYLDHLEEFETLYQQGKLPSAIDDDNNKTQGTFHGLVVVVAVQKSTAGAVADKLARDLCAQRLDDLDQVTPEQILFMREPGRGAVCTALVVQHLGRMRKLVNKSSSEGVSLVFVGCTAEEVEKLESISGAKEKKKAIGMLTAWKKLDCGTILDVPRALVLEDRICDENLDALNDIVDALREACVTLPVTDSRLGVLVFCPGIPGCGKSCLFESETLESVRKSLRILDPKQSRNLVVLSGDQVKQKYWPLVIKKRLQDQSSVFITDKNAPMSSWKLIAEAAAKTKSVAVAVTYPSALKTTRINGIRDSQGTLQGEQDHHYPFCLPFLAVCMMRVLTRMPGTHEGRLDSGSERACMVVVKFFCLYRSLTAEDFEQRLGSHFEQAGAMLSMPSIPVPFFLPNNECDSGDDDVDSLPHDLHHLLVEAIQVHFGCDVIRQDATKESSSYLDSLELRLRESLDCHRAHLESLTVPETTSRQRFASKLVETVAEVDTLDSMSYLVAPPFITLASLDVDVDAVHDILRSTSAGDDRFRPFWAMLGQQEDASTNDSSSWTNLLVQKPHVTMAHFLQWDQASLRAAFEPLVGTVVPMTATALLWSDRTAALAVTILQSQQSSSSISGDDDFVVTRIPSPKNAFAHVTVWCSSNAMAVESNDLPMLVASGKAHQVEFVEPVELTGTVSLWTRTRGQ